jgi:hypothetical protein
MHVPMRHPQRSALAHRLTLGCEAYRITLRELGQLAGLPRQRVLMIAVGREPIAPWAERLARILSCDARWLEHGSGAAPAWASAAPGQFHQDGG